MGVIGGIASLQILALGFGVLRRTPSASDTAPPANAPAPPLQIMMPADAASPIPEAGEKTGSVGFVTPHPAAEISVVGPVPAALGEVADAMTGNQVVPGFSSGEDPVGTRAPLGANLGGALRSAVPSAPAGKVSALPSPPFGAPPAASAPAASAPGGGEDSPSLSAALAVAARKNELSGEPILERLMSTGAELRASGNMQGALQAFRQVESALPDHPRILAELGATLSQMGLTEKANGYWERVEGVGPVVAGAYFPLAGQQLRGEAPPAADSSVKVMKIGEVKVEEAAPTSEGQKVTLRVVVDADPNARPIGEDLTLLVYFYDRVTDGEVKASTADTSYDYPSAPYDWQSDGTEEIIVKYNQPVFTDEQKLELGERSFYGYAIELYYRNQIQDKVVMPEDIARLRLESPADTAPAGGFLGPENALFPDPVFP